MPFARAGIMPIRDATPADFPAVLQLNAESVHYLSPLDQVRLQQLHDAAHYHRVAVQAGCVIAFLIALREGTAYDSINYLWFARHYHQFLYIDRVVVSQACRGAGVGRLLYEDVFRVARASGISCVTCEFDVEPPNDVSRRFHASFGFSEVGRQRVADGTKQVSLQAAFLPSAKGG